MVRGSSVPVPAFLCAALRCPGRKATGSNRRILSIWWISAKLHVGSIEFRRGSGNHLSGPPWSLLTDPLKHAFKRREIAQDRPRFEPEFWGPQVIEGIHAQAGGWPHLVQLLAETLLDLVNQRSLGQVDEALFQEGLDKAIVRGHNVLYQLLQQECQSEAEWEYISGFRRSDTQPSPPKDDVYRALRRRLLVEEVGPEWRLRVPLMLRWLRKRG
jgi:hypothetical protein